MPLRNMVIKTRLLFVVLIPLLVGCASTLSSTLLSDPQVATHHYTQPFKEVVDAAVEVARKSWHIKSVDEEYGIIQAVDADILRSYEIRVNISKEPDNMTKVTISTKTSADIGSAHRELIAAFYKDLDNRLIH